MNKVIVLLFVIGFCFKSFFSSAQMVRDTLATITVVGKKPSSKAQFSSFTKSLFRHSKKRALGLSSYSDNIEQLYPLSFKVTNTTPYRLRIDSIYIRGSFIDTNAVELLFNTYHNNKRYCSSKATFTHFSRKVNVAVFKSGLYLPTGTSYLSFNLKPTPLSKRIKYDLYLYYNTKVFGWLYFYNRESDNFKLFDMSKIGLNSNSTFNCPQMKIFYTVIP